LVNGFLCRKNFCHIRAEKHEIGSGLIRLVMFPTNCRAEVFPLVFPAEVIGKSLLHDPLYPVNPVELCFWASLFLVWKYAIRNGNLGQSKAGAQVA